MCVYLGVCVFVCVCERVCTWERGHTFVLRHDGDVPPGDLYCMCLAHMAIPLWLSLRNCVLYSLCLHTVLTPWTGRTAAARDFVVPRAPQRHNKSHVLRYRIGKWEVERNWHPSRVVVYKE